MAGGQVITFYSYKGGTGRSMALANVACVLAQRGHSVLAIDWDLEAPGLHQFFERLSGHKKSLTEQPGLIELLCATRDVLPRLGYNSQNEDAAIDVLREVSWRDFVQPTAVSGLSLLPAGRLDRDYGHRVRNFDWQKYFVSCPALLPALAYALGEQYEYILIDSRTGITDIGGICTALLPEKLVIVFTPARQSLMGSLIVAEGAVDYRRQSSDLRPLELYPLPSRVEVSEVSLRHRWRFGDPPEIEGYQLMFEELLKRAYGYDDRPDLESYFNEVEVPHGPRYAYGEEIAVLLEPEGDRLSLASAFKRFTDLLISSDRSEVDGVES